MSIIEKLDAHRFKKWGLRADPLLWVEFKDRAKAEKVDSIDDAIKLLEKVFLDHVGYELNTSTQESYPSIYQEKSGVELGDNSSFSGLALLKESHLNCSPYNKGMSAGMVSLRFWLLVKAELKEILS